MPKTSSPDAVVVPMAVASPVRTFRTQQCAPIPRPPRHLLLVQRSTNKSDICAEEYGKTSVHTRLHNPENTGAVVQTTSENDSSVENQPNPLSEITAAAHTAHGRDHGW